MMQLPAEIASIVTVFRPAAGSYVNGVWTESGGAGFSIRAFVEPAPPERMAALEEGRRTAEGILVLTATELLTASEKGSKSPDRLTWDGKTWQVETVDRLAHFALAEAHYEVLAVRCAT